MAERAEQESGGVGWRPVLALALFAGMWFFWQRPPAPPPPIPTTAESNVRQEVWKPISNFYIHSCGKTLSEVSGRAEPILRSLGNDQYEMEWPNPNGRDPIKIHYDAPARNSWPLNDATKKMFSPGEACQ